MRFASHFPRRPLRVFVAAFALACCCARAQNLILRPAVVPLAGQPGQSVTQVLTLQNDSDQPLDFVLEARDVVVRDGARVFLEPGQLAGSVAATAVFAPPALRVEPHSSAGVTATFTLPAAIRHRAVVAYFRGTTMVQAGARRATLSLGALFTFRLSDRVSVQAGTLAVTPPSASRNAQLTTRLTNTGDEPVVPAGMAVLLDAAGQVVGKAPFAPKRLLPGEALDLNAEYAGDLQPGAYRAVATFDVGGSPLTLGSAFEVE
jgi:hypothetical protein